LLTGAAVVGAAVMEEEAVTDLAAGVEGTLLSVVVGTDSVVVTHLADSPAEALVRDSAGRGDFLPLDSTFLTGTVVTELRREIIGRWHSQITLSPKVSPAAKRCRRSVLALLLPKRGKARRFAYAALPPAHFQRNPRGRG
jgi:hypothetical protein